MKEHLGDKIKDTNGRIFEQSDDALYGSITRGLIHSGLRTKEDADSARYSLHPHCFRKYFHTNMLTAGVDRGVVEGFEGRKFALDSAYLRMTDDELKTQYLKGMDRLTFLSTATNNHVRSRLEELEAEMVEIRNERLDSKKLSMTLQMDNLQLRAEVEDLKKKLRDRGVTSDNSG